MSTVVPTPTMVITPALVIVAVPGVALVYVIAPLLADVGAMMVGATEPNTTLAALKLKPVKDGVLIALLISIEVIVMPDAGNINWTAPPRTTSPMSTLRKIVDEINRFNFIMAAPQNSLHKAIQLNQ